MRERRGKRRVAERSVQIYGVDPREAEKGKVDPSRSRVPVKLRVSGRLEEGECSAELTFPSERRSPARR